MLLADLLGDYPGASTAQDFSLLVLSVSPLGLNWVPINEFTIERSDLCLINTPHGALIETVAVLD